MRVEYTSDGLRRPRRAFRARAAGSAAIRWQSRTSYGTFAADLPRAIRLDAGHEPALRGDAVAGAAELLRCRARTGRRTTTTSRSARQSRPAADEVVEHRRDGRALLQVGRRGVRRRLLQAPGRLHLHVHDAAADQRRAVSGHAAAQRRVSHASAASSWRCRISCASCPSPFNGLGVYANYTFTDSTAHFPGQAGDSDAARPVEARRERGRSYEKGGFNGRVSVNFHGSYIDTVGADNTQDRFYDTNSQLDVTIARGCRRTSASTSTS